MQRAVETVIEQLGLATGQVRRLFHGRGGCAPGLEWLVVDYLPPVAVIRAYSDELPEPVDSLVEALVRAGVEGVVLQLRGRGRTAQSEVLAGEVPDKLVVEEAGLKYQVRPLQNQNAGLFLDMRPGRDWVREHARDKRVLNLFSYTCSFSVAAMAGGAVSALNIDMSSSALATGRTNHQLNSLPTKTVGFMAVDLLRSWGRVRKNGPFDLVVIDPPSFQPGSFVAERDYRKVLRRLDEFVASGGQVLACHNDPAHSEQFLRQLMEQEAPGFTFRQRLAQAEDFPEKDAENGLKVLLYQKDM
ncbi:class I SAM-dependent methyltransferase [Marinobacterium mangrovicola]|uniref:23S rRNA (Cytosine1962-C5)-methyltransferase n=1 Tax=Marinobacterium mangrovicola TaxID=1476959 RepID=A0A4R1G3K1_9GAMM|nr:class I SAM-dependent methyltransferase [Marinobacterium mangrovicola]TCK02537.1 23S rRNA (cytosine1962-C5)-methyltransferase [Marinobacterium mangrovicola]